MEICLLYRKFLCQEEHSQSLLLISSPNSKSLFQELLSPFRFPFREPLSSAFCLSPTYASPLFSTISTSSLPRYLNKISLHFTVSSSPQSMIINVEMEPMICLYQGEKETQLLKNEFKERVSPRLRRIFIL